MFPTIDLNPEAAASALDELADDLRRVPSVLTSNPDLSPRALAEAENLVQHWAVEHGVPSVCVPERPVPAELTVQRTLLFLSDLAAVIRYIAGNIEPQRTMKQVVARLGARNDEALGEVLELDFALAELLESTTIIAGAAEALHAALAKIGQNGAGIESLPQLQRDAGLIHSTLEQLVAGHRDINAGVRAWLEAPGSTTALS